VPGAERVEAGGGALGVLRAGVAALLAVALVAQFVIGADRNGLTPVNFFSYYTVLSNAPRPWSWRRGRCRGSGVTPGRRYRAPRR